MNDEKELDAMFDADPDEQQTDPDDDDKDTGADDSAEGAGDGAGEGKKQPEEDALKKRIAELEGEVAGERGKHTDKDAFISKLLSELGYEDEDAYHADKAGKSKADYVKSRDDELTIAQAKAIVETKKHEKMAADDLAELKRQGFVDSTVSFIGDIGSADVVKRFCNLRDLGLSATEAYRAAAGAALDERIERGAKRAASGKEHLTTPKSRGASGNGSVMSAREKAEYREWLGTDDDKAIEAAWRRAQGKA